MKRRLVHAALMIPLLFFGAWIVFPFPRAAFTSYPSGTMIMDRAGRPLRVTLGPGDVDCRPLQHVRRDTWIAQAMVAAEDERFWTHPGIDALAIARAIGQNVWAGRKVSGASTLSTQVIRLVQPRSRTLVTKIVETFRALQMERQFSKEEILAQYLNRAPFGGNVIGIEAAARRYFGKDASDLSLPEAALLAGLPQSPSRLRPDRYPSRARKRQEYVLSRMVSCGMIDEAQKNDALSQQLAVRPAPYPFEAPHFCDLAQAKGAATRTTLDSAMQQLAEEALMKHAKASGVPGGAVVVLDVRSGAVRALVGSPDFFDAKNDGQVDAAVAPRSAGSTLKPFAYALAFDRGLVTPQTVLADVPMSFKDFEPANFDEHFLGLVTTRDALILSLNIPALELEERIGQPVLYRTLRELGLDSLSRAPESYGLGLVLGNGEVRLLDLVNAYACLARGGDYLPYRLTEGEAIGAPRNVFSREAAWLVADILGGPERGMDSVGHAADVRLPRVAWKTGTSSGFRDAWTIAWNPEYVVGVWIGCPDGAASDDLVGKRVAAPVAWDIFRQVYADNEAPWYARPEGMKQREVCTVSGCPAGPDCPRTGEDWYIAGATPFQTCPVHARGPEEIWPAEITAFLSRQSSTSTTVAAKLRITSPARDSSFRMVPGFSAAAQRLPFAATVSGHWFVDDAYVGEGTTLLWPLARGRHHVVCSDALGASDRVDIRVE